MVTVVSVVGLSTSWMLASAIFQNMLLANCRKYPTPPTLLSRVLTAQAVGARCTPTCPCPTGTICCPDKSVCEVPLPYTNPEACGEKSVPWICTAAQLGTCGVVVSFSWLFMPARTAEESRLTRLALLICFEEGGTVCMRRASRSWKGRGDLAERGVSSCLKVMR